MESSACLLLGRPLALLIRRLVLLLERSRTLLLPRRRPWASTASSGHHMEYALSVTGAAGIANGHTMGLGQQRTLPRLLGRSTIRPERWPSLLLCSFPR